MGYILLVYNHNCSWSVEEYPHRYPRKFDAVERSLCAMGLG